MIQIRKKIWGLNSIFSRTYPNNFRFATLSLRNQSKFSSLSNELNDKPIENKEEVIDEIDNSKKKIQKPIIEQNLYNYEQTKVKIDSNDKENPFVFTSKYGLLKLIACPINPKHLESIKGIHYFNHHASTNYIKKIIKEDKKSLLVFEPDTPAKNLRELYISVERIVRNTYFGSKKKPKNPFSKCQSPKEIFNLHRRILMDIKQHLNKICILVNYDGSIRLKGSIPNSNLIKPYLNQNYKDPDEPFTKLDFLIPYNIYQGMINSDHLEKAGIPIKTLDNKKIYPFYGVWAPTRQGYLSFLAEYIEKNLKTFHSLKNAIDIGCGTGILGIMMLLKGGVKKVFAIDKNPVAVRNSRLNAEILEVGDKFYSEKMNLDLDQTKNEKNLQKLKFPQKYDLIISNPPWTIASFLNEKHDLDNGVYDPEEKFLKSLFLFASIYFF